MISVSLFSIKVTLEEKLDKQRASLLGTKHL